MTSQLKILKGIHPGFVLERELDKRQLRKATFASKIEEYPQTINAITKGKRGMNTALSLKIEHELDLEEGFFMILQIYYEIEEEKKKQGNTHPNLNNIRKIMFWDTKIESINWQKQKKAIIKRIFERGNEAEKGEIINFYGKNTVKKILKDYKNATL